MPMTDERIVKMRFDNSKFERNIAKSQNSVEKFKQALNFDETSRGIEKFSKATNGLDFSHFFNNIQKLTDRFTGLGDAGDYVLRRIRAGFEEVAMSVERFIKDITLAQMTIGQGKYDSLNRAVQTIVASGSNTEKEAYDVMDRVMVYTDQTSHNFETMVSQISALTSKGVGLEKAERLMEGFANASTKAGAEAGRAATAMQVYTKAMGSFLTKNEFDTLNLTARVVTKEWREELIAAGLAAKDLEKDTKGNIKTAKKYGKQVVVTADTLEDTLSKKWASKNTLAIFGERYMFGDTLDELRHPEEAMDSFGKTAYMTGQRALTFADAMNAIKESISSGWMQSYRIIFGDLSEAMETFTNICDRVIDSIEEIADIRNRILRQWKLSGGRDSLLEIFFGDFDKDTREGAYGLIDVLDDVGKLIYSGIADFFGIFADPDDRYMFHKDPTYLASWLGIQAANISAAVQEFIQSIRDWFDAEIKMGDKTVTRMQLLQEIISGLVSVLALGIMLIGGIATFISDIGTQLAPSIEKILGFFGELGQKIYGDTFNAKKENTIVAFFHELAETFRPVTEGINEVVAAIVDLLHELLGIDQEKNNTGNFFKNLGEGLKMVAKIISSVGKPVFKFLRGIIETIGVFLKGGINATTMREAGEKFGASFNEFIIGIGEALPESFGFLKEWIQNLFGTGEQEVKEGSESLLEIIGQTNKDAKKAQKKSSDGGLGINSILNGSNIAVWLGVGGLLGLDLLINRARKAIKGVQWFVEELGSSLKKGFRVQYDNNAEYFYKIAKAVALICAAVVILGSMPINKLLQGVAAVAAVMAVMFILFKILKTRTSASGWKDSLAYAGQMAALAFGLSAMAIAIGVLSLALIPFSLMSTDGLIKAFAGLGGVLAELLIFMVLIKKLDVSVYSLNFKGMYKLAIGIAILVFAIKSFANMTWDQYGRAMAGLGGVLLQILAFMELFKVLGLSTKALNFEGIAKFAAAIGILVFSIQPFANMTWDQYGRAMAGLGGVLLQILAFMELFKVLGLSTKALKFDGIIRFVAALAILVLAIQPFAQLTWDQFAKTMAGLGGVLLQILAFMELFKVLGLSTKALKFEGIIAFVAAIAILVQAILPFANITWEQYARTMAGLGGVLAEIIIFMEMFKHLGLSTKALHFEGIIGFVAGISILIQAIQPFAQLTWDEYARTMAGLGGVLLEIAAFMFLLKKIDYNNLKIAAIIGFAAGISALVTAIQPFAGMTWDEYAVVMAGLGGVLLELIGFMALLKVLDMKNKNLTQVLIIAAALSTMAVAFGLALNLVKGMDYMTIAAFANGLSVAIIALAGAIAICSKFGSIKGVLIMAAGLAAIIAVIALLGPWLLSSIGAGLADMSSRIATMADMFEIFSTRMNGVDDGAVNKAKTMINEFKDLLGDIGTFGKVSVSSSAFSTAMFNLGTGLEMLSNHTRGIKGMNENEAFSLITGLASCSRDLDVIAKMDIRNLTSNISGLGGALSIYAEGANAAGGITTDDQVKDVKDVIEFMKEITKTIGEDAGVLELPDNLPDASSLGDFGAQLAALATALSSFEKASRGFGGHTDKALRAIEFFRDLKRELDMYNTVNDLSYITELNDGFANQGVTVTSLQTFGSNIEQLGLALNQFVLSTTEKDEVTGEVKAKPYEAGIAALEQFAALQARLEAIKFGGVISWIEGEGRKIEDLGNSIQMLGSQLMTFSNKLTGRGAEGEAGVTFDSTVAQQAVDSMTTILGFLIKFNNKMGRIGGFWNIVKNFAFGRLYNLEDIGDQFGKFGDGLATLGTGLANEGWKSIDQTTVDFIIGTMDSLIDFLNNANNRLPTIGGLEKAWDELWHGHDYTFEDLSKQIGKMGDGIGKLGTGLTVGGWSKISGDATNAAFGAIESILKIMIQIGKLQTVSQDVSGWDGNMYAGAEDLVQFIDYIGNTDTAGLESIAEMIRLVDSVMDEWDIDVGHITAFKEMCEALASLATVDPSYDWKNIGLSIDTGIAAGLRENKTIVTTAAEEVALAAYTAAMAKLKAGSPSKVFIGVGSYISEGMAIGIVQSAGEVTGSVDEMSEMAISTAKDAMASVSRALAEDVSSHPTITPVLDLSNVNAGMADLNRNFGSRSISVEPGSYNRPGIIRPDTSISKADMIGNAVNMNNEVARSLGVIAAKSNDPAIKEAFNKIVEANNEMNEKVLKKLENIQIVLDSGAIAGGVTDTVDGNIGRKTFYATRRN